MENASKALIFAGSVLISLMIIGALVLMFNGLSNYQKSGTIDTRGAQVIEFNNQYETFNRNNVRGSDIYSLLNKVIDYNRRKSSEGTGQKDEGQFLAYEPMTITFDLGDDWENKFRATNENGFIHLIQQRNYEQNATQNTFEAGIKDRVKELENRYGADSINSLAIVKEKIFLENNPDEESKERALNTFNKLSKKQSVTRTANLNNDWNQLLNKHRVPVYQYYEYMQFKRARFNCTHVDYNNQTGRIIRMDFTFSGRFE